MKDLGDLPGSSRCAPEAASASSPSRVTIPIARETVRRVLRPVAVRCLDIAREIAMEKIFVDATDEICDMLADKLMWNYYPHMCRDEHAQIGHWDSESEMCPVCEALAQGIDSREASETALAGSTGGKSPTSQSEDAPDKPVCERGLRWTR